MLDGALSEGERSRMIRPEGNAKGEKRSSKLYDQSLKRTTTRR